MSGLKIDRNYNSRTVVLVKSYKLDFVSTISGSFNGDLIVDQPKISGLFTQDVASSTRAIASSLVDASE